jgi:acyl carrier protein
MPVAVEELRRLIVDAAPDPALAAPALDCDEDALLDELIPFSSVIVLGVVVAVEDRYAIRVTKQMLARALSEGVTLRKLVAMVEAAEPQ